MDVGWGRGGGNISWEGWREMQEKGYRDLQYGRTYHNELVKNSKGFTRPVSSIQPLLLLNPIRLCLPTRTLPILLRVVNPILPSVSCTIPIYPSIPSMRPLSIRIRHLKHIALGIRTIFLVGALN